MKRECTNTGKPHVCAGVSSVLLVHFNHNGRTVHTRRTQYTLSTISSVCFLSFKLLILPQAHLCYRSEFYKINRSLLGTIFLVKNNSIRNTFLAP